MVKIEILKNTCANSRPVSIGEVIDVTESTARQLERTGKAKRYEAPVQEAPVSITPIIEAEAPKKVAKSKAKAKRKSKSTQKKDN
jgi:hypothetical protein|tara:strand:+ start:1120 stop:1374 length:255 start_codon:yes stop_codon:yes gene_type:complete